MPPQRTNRIELVLVDFDDTLVLTEPRFQNARRALYGRLAAAGFDGDVVRAIHDDEVDPAMLVKYGLGPRRMEHSFRETYAAACARIGRELEEAIAEECAAYGRAVGEGDPEPLEGALASLETLAAVLPTVVYTQAGDRDYQLQCVRRAGVVEIVGAERIRICSRKGPDDFLAAVAEFGASPETTWMIGNSVRSDINPALTCGARAILVGSGPTWVHEQAEPVSDAFIRVGSFPDAATYLLSLLETE